LEEGPRSIVRRVLESNPVFEAFGNAQTCRNNNSSRFGRFIRLQFDVTTPTISNPSSPSSSSSTPPPHYLQAPTCTLAGSSCSTYLLEKSRVVYHAANEQNYHIFYQLLAAPEEEKAVIWKEGLVGATAEDFLYLRSCSGGDDDENGAVPTSSREGGGRLHGGEEDTKTLHHQNQWKQTTNAMKLFGFENQSLHTVMRALCTVLQLGNLTFSAPTRDHPGVDGGGSIITSHDELDRLSRLMDIPKEEIVNALTERVNWIRGESVVVRIGPSDAKDGCDALAKEIYARIFDVLVGRINEGTSPQNLPQEGQNGCGGDDDWGYGTINLLDIFGFEMFDTNRFEQFCINYANERLQQKYIMDNFDCVRDEYTVEGIGTFEFTIADNADVVSLFEGNITTKKTGLIAMLNEECITPNATDNTFVHNLKRTLCDDSSRLLTDKLHERYEFGVKHFAGFVTYDASKFLQSNVDRISKDLLDCACKSSNTLIQTEFQKIAALKQNQSNVPSRKAMIASHSVISKFRSQLDTLIDIVKPTRTRFIRCIKPNGYMEKRVTDHRETINQMVAAGLVTAATISRATFPNKLSYDIVWERFRCLYDEMTIAGHCSFGDDGYNNPPPIRQNGEIHPPTTAAINNHNNNENNTIKIPPELRTSVQNLLQCFLSTPFTRADGIRVKSYTCAITKVYFRAGALECLEADRFRYYSTHATKVQSWFRSLDDARWYTYFRRMLIVCQAAGRRKGVRGRYLRTQKAVVILQAWVRGVGHFQRYRGRKRAVLTLQRRGRGMVIYRHYLQMIHASILIQSHLRGKISHTNYNQTQNDIVAIQAQARYQIAYRQFRNLRHAILTLQHISRRGKEGQNKFLAVAEKVRANFLQKRKAAITIQASTRAKIARVKYHQMRRAAAEAFFTRLSRRETFASRAKKRGRSLGRSSHGFPSTPTTPGSGDRRRMLRSVSPKKIGSGGRRVSGGGITPKRGARPKTPSRVLGVGRESFKWTTSTARDKTPKRIERDKTPKKIGRDKTPKRIGVAREKTPKRVARDKTPFRILSGGHDSPKRMAREKTPKRIGRRVESPKRLTKSREKTPKRIGRRDAPSKRASTAPMISTTNLERDSSKRILVSREKTPRRIGRESSSKRIAGHTLNPLATPSSSSSNSTKTFKIGERITSPSSLSSNSTKKNGERTTPKLTTAHVTPDEKTAPSVPGFAASTKTSASRRILQQRPTPQSPPGGHEESIISPRVNPKAFKSSTYFSRLARTGTPKL